MQIGRKEPLVSVFILTYNGAKWVAEAIVSVLAQTFRDFQLVISDDCSTDDTISIVNTFKDGRIMVIQNEINLNTMHSRKLIHECKTKYFKMLMQDDILEVDCLEKQISVLEQYPEVGITSSSYTLMIDRSRTPYKYDAFREGLYTNPQKLMRDLLLKGNRIGSPSQALIRTDSMQNRPISWIYSYLGELTWYYYIFSQGFHYYHIRKPLSCYRVQTDMKTLNLRGSVVNEYKGFIDKAGHLCGVKLGPRTLLSLYVSDTIRICKKSIMRLILKSSWKS